ncbi:tyrosyl-tRNA synthetase, putative [Theileria equi strain WA]|uniref:tyrosine--tRNA ligase n=1 Tax=Theileria equi strain WA TaxID=1537102 RepID=L1LEP2_THEEQ|nr:tyrosyl-tRNA synthetase, putative [Theileria equi strain WA]EKX73796.1 tyrosyl-tRNA synthetase, putative [Theileria equi strain WA]|eukprot:XP_004833248.1 tyrosyl-tRNA synthetase, putative [Theileria equi strain WA]
MKFFGAISPFIALMFLSRLLEEKCQPLAFLHVQAFKSGHIHRKVNTIHASFSNFSSSSQPRDGQCPIKSGTPTVTSRFLADCVDRGLIFQATDMSKLDDLLCESAKGIFCQDSTYPAVYYGIDCTNNFIHEGTLLQLLLLRKFLSQKLNLVIVIGGGTTVVGDPSYKQRKNRIKKDGNVQVTKSTILDKPWNDSIVEEGNEKAILGAIYKILSPPLTVDGKEVYPNIINTSENDANISNRIKSPYNVIIINNRKLYENVSLMEYLEIVAKNMNLGRMLSRDSIKLRINNESDKVERKRPFSGINMDLSELMYMSLQAMDFIYVASKFNVKVQLGGSDQMGNIVSGLELADALGMKDLVGVTTPLLQDKHGEKISKSNANCLLKITRDTVPSVLWTHFRNIDDDLVLSYLKWLTDVSMEKIEDSINEHINTAKILLADELSAKLYGKESVDAIHKYGLSKDFQSLQPYLDGKMNVPIGEYNLFASFSQSVPHTRVSEEKLKEGIEFHELLDSVRIPFLATGIFYTNKQSIRDGICKINGRLETNIKHKVTCEDIKSIKSQDGHVLNYIVLQVGKRQIYFVLIDK